MQMTSRSLREQSGAVQMGSRSLREQSGAAQMANRSLREQSGAVQMGSRSLREQSVAAQMANRSLREHSVAAQMASRNLRGQLSIINYPLSSINYPLKKLPLYHYQTMSIKLTAQQKSKPIYTVQDVWDIIHPIHMRENRQRRLREYFWVFAIDRERYLQVAELLAIGSDNRVHIKPADALRLAIQKNADYVIFIHNHPKGKLEPSASDKDTTDRLIKAAEVVEIKVVDHFIINEEGFYSFAEAGLMKQLRESSTYRVLHEDEVELLKLQMEAAGEAKGLVKGEVIGLEKGKKAIAKAMLAKGYAVEEVMALTGLGKGVVGRIAKAGK